ncbi:MAG: DUF423 domain-containing protein [Candidatus Omnitrophota bacterium]|nr:DUF423 domain-containing protein [Candidatus Omnitrophota bacterium]
MMQGKVFFVLGASLGFLGVAMGAFGAHALKNKLTPDMMAIFEVGVRYHMYHALALLAAGWAATQYQSGAVNLGGWLFLSGVCVFSGSLYVLAFTAVKAWGAVTPIGGLLLLGGWVSLALGVWRAQ